MSDVQARVQRTLAVGLALSLALTAFLNVAVLVVPIYDMQLYDRVLQSRNLDTLAMLSVACVVGLLLYGALEYLRGACFVAVAEAVGRHLNGAVLQEGVRRAAAEDRRTGAELVRDLNEIQGFLASGAVAVPLDAVCAPLFLVIMTMLHPAFACLAVAGIAILVLTGLFAEWRVRPALLAAQEGQRAAGQALSRNLADPDIAEGLGMLPALGRRWAVGHGGALAAMNRAGARALATAGVSRFVRMGMQAATMGTGAALVLAGAATPGSLMGANLMTSRVYAPFDQLVASWRYWALAHAAWRRINVLLSKLDEVPTARNPDSPPGLALHQVCVRTKEGRVLLRDIDLVVPPGMLLVVVGPNGAGKTTLLRLIAGLVTPTSGSVQMDGGPVSAMPGGIGFLPQSVSLLDGTVADNVGRFHEDELARTIAAARLAEVHESIGRMTKGYATELRGNGSSLSGGMRQRVGLARAVFGRPRLLVLDEPDASLDGEGSDALQRALRACCDDGAVVVVTSHRPGLRRGADRIVTLEDGSIVAGPGPEAAAVSMPVAAMTLQAATATA